MYSVRAAATEARSRPSTCIRSMPCVDGSELARTIFTSQRWSVQPRVRPVGAVHMTAGHNPPRIRSRSKSRIRQCAGTSGLS